MPLTEEQVRETLKQVIDPELFVNIIDLGLVYTVTVAPAQGDSIAATTDAQIASQPVQPPTADRAIDSSEVSPKEDVFIEMTMTSPACPAGPQLIGNAKQVVGRLPGVNNVEVKIVMTPPWTPDLMTEEARDQLGIF
ncbi:MAG TPA: metal-sulfur cluster assembly factor [Pirellulales bacterium]|jgi:metal-sulfur cluster biosynthetic enzyme|nr:metal-sulfur cluster assembly factor [Pirellulales bacterium]